MDQEGIVLLLDVGLNFHNNEDNETNEEGNFKFILRYVKKYKPYLFQLVIGFAGASLLTLVFPFLTQALVDVGIQGRNLNFIYFTSVFCKFNHLLPIC